MIAVVLWLRARLCEVVERVWCLLLLWVVMLCAAELQSWELLRRSSAPAEYRRRPLIGRCICILSVGRDRTRLAVDALRR